MTKELEDALKWWLENRPIKDSEYLFYCLDKTSFCQSYYGKPFTKRRYFMKRLCEKAGIKHFGFHAIRHLTASIQFNLGYDVATIQAILRHKSPNTTERYLKSLGLENARVALERLSGRNDNVLPFTSSVVEVCEIQSESKKPSGELSTPKTARSKLRVVK